MAVRTVGLLWLFNVLTFLCAACFTAHLFNLNFKLEPHYWNNTWNVGCVFGNAFHCFDISSRGSTKTKPITIFFLSKIFKLGPTCKNSSSLDYATHANHTKKCFCNIWLPHPYSIKCHALEISLILIKNPRVEKF